MSAIPAGYIKLVDCARAVLNHLERNEPNTWTALLGAQTRLQNGRAGVNSGGVLSSVAVRTYFVKQELLLHLGIDQIVSRFNPETHDADTSARNLGR